MHALATTDYVIILGYLTLSLIAGVIMPKRAGLSLELYFLGEERKDDMERTSGARSAKLSAQCHLLPTLKSGR